MRVLQLSGMANFYALLFHAFCLEFGEENDVLSLISKLSASEAALGEKLVLKLVFLVSSTVDINWCVFFCLLSRINSL